MGAEMAALQVLLAAATFGCLARPAEAGQALAPRLLAPQFSAFINQTAKWGFGSSGEHGPLWYDATKRRWKMLHNSSVDLFRPLSAGDRMTATVLVTDTAGVGCQAVFSNARGEDLCRGANMMGYAHYQDLFDWARNASLFVGRTTIAGRSCNEFLLVGESGIKNKSMCVDDSGAPVRYEERVKLGHERLHLNNATWEFANVVLRAPSDSIFAPLKACEEPPPPPCSDGEARELQIYRIHGPPPEPFDLENRNAADALGDAGFICGALEVAADYSKKLVTLFRLEVNSSFGPFSMCNFNGTDNVCDLDTKLVGRQSVNGLGVGHEQGQCSPNHDTGSSYSFPRKGLCRDGAALGTDGCTWGNLRRVRTVEATCILQKRGLARLCGRMKEHAPYSQGAAAIEEALLAPGSAEACPDWRPSSPEVLLV